MQYLLTLSQGMYSYHGQAEWVHDFVEEAASFPKGKHDDQVDAMSQALNRFIYHNAEIPTRT
jgi:predicted phage terminase large subunit-like protein